MPKDKRRRSSKQDNNIITEGEKELEVAEIIDSRDGPDGTEYLVQYVDPLESPSWEPTHNLFCDDILAKFLLSQEGDRDSHSDGSDKLNVGEEDSPIAQDTAFKDYSILSKFISTMPSLADMQTRMNQSYLPQAAKARYFRNCQLQLELLLNNKDS